MNKTICLIALMLGNLYVSQIAAQQTEIIYQMFPNAIISQSHYEKMKADMTTGTSELTEIYEKQIKEPANTIINKNQSPQPVKSRNHNPQNVDVNAEMKAIYQLCVCYAFSLEKKYMDKAVEYLTAWADINVADAKSNIHEEIYSQAVEGYSLIRNLVTSKQRTLIDNWMRKRVEQFIQDNDLRQNNWGSCLLRQYYLYGFVLDEQRWIDKADNSYPEWVKGNLYPNGTTTDLLGRNAFAYHAYDLLFFSRICRLKSLYAGGYPTADAFYRQDVHWGASIKKCVDFWKPYVLNPKKNPHIEFINSDWDGDKSRNDYNKSYQPSGTLYVIDELYEWDHDLKRIIDQYRQGNEFATWNLTLSAVRWRYDIATE